MKNTKTEDQILYIISWTARILSVAYIAFFLIMFIGESLGAQFKIDGETMSTNTIIGFIIVFIYFMGLILAWKWEAIGGLIVIICTIAFAIALQDNLGWLHLIMMIPGLLFLTHWFLSGMPMKKIKSKN